ncbi:MAG: hypothetical protein ACI4S3_03695 [Candidatus Gastranaerophilaceae bacterium]
MKDKCNKYESLFIFSDEETLNKHIKECEDCRIEHKKMQRVSDLIKEVKDEYKKPNYMAFKVACMLFLFIACGASIDMLDMRYGFLDTIRYGEPLTMEDLGLPTDSYGLIQVD